MARNTRRAMALGVMQEGWVGEDDDGYHFRPTRGSGGWSLYDTKAGALRSTECPRAVFVQLKVERLP